MQKQQNIKNVIFTDQKLSGELNTQLSKFRLVHHNHGALHTHDCAEFGICLSGNGIFSVSDKTYPFFNGVVSYIPPNVPHIGQNPANKESEWIFLFADPKCFGSVAPPEDGIIIWNEDAVSLLFMIINAQKSNQDKGVYYRSLLDSFFVCISSHASFPLPDCNPYIFHKICPAIQYISEKYIEKIRVKDLADLCYMSVSNFSQSFIKAIGITPMDYMHSLRISMAETLLHSPDLSITEIAYRIGYSNQSSFYRQFVKKHQISPFEYQKTLGIFNANFV